jgi:glutathione peroxidase-family protein
MPYNIIFHNGIFTKLDVNNQKRNPLFHFLVREGAFRIDLQESLYCVCKNLKL